MSIGIPGKDGAVVSTIVMVCDFDALLPHASIAVHVRTMDRSLAQAPAMVLSFGTRIQYWEIRS